MSGEDSDRPDEAVPDGLGITAEPDGDRSLTPPAPFVAPSWSSPAPPGPDPATPPPPPGQYGAPQYGAPQYGEAHGVGLPGVAGWGAVSQAPKPGVVPLRPLSVGEILDGSISYIRRDPRTVLGISAGIALIIAVLQFVVLAVTSRSLAVSGGTTTTTADALGGSLGSLTATLTQSAVTWVLGVVATGLLTIVMGQAVLGRRVTLEQTWSRTSSRLLPLFGLTILVAVVVGGLGAVGVGLAVLIGWLLTSTSTALGVVVGILAGVGALVLAGWANIRLLLAPVALVLEGAGVITSMRRSWELVSGAWWRTFGIYLLGSILAGILSSVITVPFTAVGAALSFTSLSSDSATVPLAEAISISLATLVSTTLVMPFTSGVVALLYIDRRIRREALDIELARAAGVGV
jgi:hypothetical protein